jgi:nucleotide-binding universal stress UspA family protein
MVSKLYRRILIATDGSEYTKKAVDYGIELANDTGAKLHAIDRAEAAGLEVEGIIAQGHPADEIINYAEKNSIDLIVMGTLGKSGLDRFLLGSVADKVIRNSKIPVIAVPVKDKKIEL